MSFERERPAARGKMLSLRVTTEEDELLQRLADELELDTKAGVLRRALDFWLENDPKAKRLRKTL